MKTDPLRGVYRAFVLIGLLAFLALVMGYQIGRSLALADNQRDAREPWPSWGHDSKRAPAKG